MSATGPVPAAPRIDVAALEALVGRPGHESLPDLGVGIVGAGWIVRECHLPAYRAAGIRVVGIASRRKERAQALAARFGIERVNDSWQELLAETEVEILDIAYPPTSSRR